MAKLKYGVNQIPGVKGGEIHILGDSPDTRSIKIKLPEAQSIPDILKTPQQNSYSDQINPNINEQIRNKILSNMSNPLQKSIDESVQKYKGFKELHNIRKQIAKTQQILDDMDDYASSIHPGIAKDLENDTDYFADDYRKLVPEHDDVYEKLLDLQDEFMDHPLHDEYFKKYGVKSQSQ